MEDGAASLMHMIVRPVNAPVRITACTHRPCHGSRGKLSRRSLATAPPRRDQGPLVAASDHAPISLPSRDAHLLLSNLPRRAPSPLSRLSKIFGGVHESLSNVELFFRSLPLPESWSGSLHSIEGAPLHGIPIHRPPREICFFRL